MRKRSMALCLSVVMAASLAGCGAKETAAPTTEAATTAAAETSEAAGSEEVFTGTSAGMQGPITVALTVKDGEITKAEITESHETPAVAAVALERIPAQIVEHQTTTVDAVTGATIASYGIMRAAEDAAKQAGLDLDALKANAFKAEAGPDETWDTELLVVGGGGAGFSAAITAAQEGAKVTLIEKSSFLGGNTMMAGGAINAVDTEAQAGTILSEAQKNTLDSYLALDPSDAALKFDQFPEWKEVLVQLQSDINEFYAANEGKTAGVDMPGFDSVALHMWHIYVGGLREMNDGSWISADETLARTMAEHALESYEWTGTIGLDVKSRENGSDSLFTVLGAMWPRTHPIVASTQLIDALKKAAEDLGVEIYTETAATRLLTDESGRVVGSEAKKADGTRITIKATRGVILASGGYCANPAMVKEYDKYWGDDLSDRTLTTNVGTNKGDGINMAMEIGADVTGLGIAQMMPSSSPVKGTMTDGVWADASEQIWIDGNAKRFVNEYAERDVLAKASLKLDDGIFYIIYAGSGMKEEDGKCKGATLDQSMFGTSLQDMVDNGHIWYGSTLAELAEASKTPAAGVAPAFTEEALREVIETYNSYVENQKDEDFGKEVLNGAIDLEAIENNDDVGIFISPRKSSLHHTMGGVVIDENASVLDKDGNAIAGLWAAGEVTGGVHGGNRLGGNAEADIFTFGHIAGMSAAKSEAVEIGEIKAAEAEAEETTEAAAEAEAAKVEYKAGTYTAKVTGMKDMTVKVTFSEDKIEDIALEHEETPGIGEPVCESMPKEIIEKQSLAVDSVSGATLTSQAILDGVADCVAQASGK
ncbi:MAG: FAD-dependent oxidoreductase [Eubacteriales bacterium]|nr:FAD-dependent oxidoreductase [Eubacteriales bacterium]